MTGLDPTIALVIPVFEDDRIYRAIQSALAQITPFDAIIVQDPKGQYSKLADLDWRLKVIHVNDNNLFHGLDNGLGIVTSDYVVMMGADDFFIDMNFVRRAKDALRQTRAPIYIERTVILGRVARLWPPINWVFNGLVLPSHFGSVFKTDLARKFRMDSYSDQDILANDTIWLLDVMSEMKGRIVGSNVVSFAMAAGGVSTQSKMAPIRNFRSILRKSRRRGYGFFYPFQKSSVALVCKLFFIRKVLPPSLSAQLNTLPFYKPTVER